MGEDGKAEEIDDKIEDRGEFCSCLGGKKLAQAQSNQKVVVSALVFFLLQWLLHSAFLEAVSSD